ncbi:hypothetical protein K2173_010763 [Erythroxylum novogranatense]|uniref:Uncharacterized protein n=1 Tax=Erythroxylum novogranatense TaxID=1862640 RepID=A0AAV8SQV6_9ROSI|nr:hypothetical protein K2173_010763 [Erythroxylum novogranatense]
MKIKSSYSLLIVLVVCVSGFTQTQAQVETFSCKFGTKCYGKYVDCPYECPSLQPKDPKAKACYVNCHSPKCKPECKHRKPTCESPGTACYDPRFIGGDGVVFYFHGKSNEHFSLVSDTNLQINSRFIGHRPAGRTRDFTWIQALGILFNSRTFSLEATNAETWDSEVDHLKFTYNGQDLVIPEASLSNWHSPEKDVKVERVSSKNSVIVTLKDTAEILVNVVPVTKEDDKVHKYQVPANDCFVHLEVQFRFSNLSPKVDGVLGRTYRPDFESPTKPGVAMPVLGGEEKYRLASLLSADCKTCIFSPETGPVTSSRIDYGTLDCTSGASAGYGLVCKK